MKTFFIILLVLVIVLFFPLKFNIHFFYNINKNRGSVLFSFYFIPIIFYRLKLNNGKLITNNKKETKEKELDFFATDMDFSNYFTLALLKQLYLKELLINCEYGKAESAYQTAMISGGAMMLLSFLKIFILTKKKNASTYFNSKAFFNRDRFVFSFKGEIFLTVFCVILSLIFAQIKVIRKRRNKNGKQLSSN